MGRGVDTDFRAFRHVPQNPIRFFQTSRSVRMFEKGVQHYNAGRYYSALDIFRRLMDYPPGKNTRLTASTLMTMKSYFHAGRPEEAMNVGRSFLVRFPGSSYLDDVYECFGDIFVTEGRYRSALENYLQARQEAKTIRPWPGWMTNWRAWTRGC